MTLDDREMGIEMDTGFDATPDAASRRVPRGHGAYVRVIALAPAECEPWIRRTATGARRVRVTARHGIRVTVRAVRRQLGRTRRRFRLAMRRIRRFVVRHVRPVVMRRRRDLRRLMKRRASDAPVIASDGRPVDADLVSFTPRSSLSKRLFPPTVTLPGSGDVVLVDAIGSTCADIVRAASRFTPQTIVVTDDPAVGVLRDAGILYEYVPRATPDGRHGDTSLAERIGWLDDVYGLDRVVTLDDFASCGDGRMVW